MAAVTKTVVETVRERDSQEFSHHDLTLDTATTAVKHFFQISYPYRHSRLLPMHTHHHSL